jgi:single-stranded DNA-binding protein
MNYVDVCAVLNENPRQVYTSSSTFNYCAEVTLPPASQAKAPTTLVLNVYGKTGDTFRGLQKGTRIYLHGSKLRFDVQSKTYSLHGGTVAQVTEAFPIFNDVILTGRCIKDIDQTDARAFKTTADGLMIANQTLSVHTGRNQADLFNFYAINTAEDKLNQAELLVNMTRKGTGLTIRAQIVTDAWTDKDTKERKTATKLKLVQMTLAPKSDESQTKQVTSQTTVASTDNVASLWGGKTAEDTTDPWNAGTNVGLPDLPGQYGNTPEFDAEPPF